MRNLKLALRTLFKTPFVSAVAIVSLAVGIGANSAIFSLFDQMLLRALPVEEPERLVNLAAPGPKPGSQSCSQAGDCDTVFSYPMFRDLEREQTSFTGIAAHRSFDANLSYKGQTLSGEGMLISGSYFPVLGMKPALGRLLGPGDDASIGESRVAVLSHDYWRSRFGEEPSILNETLVINGQPMGIVGVTPAGFRGTTLGLKPQVFVPITLRGLMQPAEVAPSHAGFNAFDNRRSYWAYLFARLRPGVAIEEGGTAINGPYAHIINEVEAPLQSGMSAETLARFRAKQVRVEAGYRGQSSLHNEARAPLFLLLSVTGVVLLIACANIANLLLARAVGRAAEMAVRLSIGAGRRHLVTQLLTESCLLAVLGGLAGLLVARWTLLGIAATLPADAAETLRFELEPIVLVFAAALALGTGLAFGLFPALHGTRPDLVTALKGTAGQPSGARAAARFRTMLATIQVALAMTLLVAAGLFIRSLMNVSRIDLGLKVDDVVTFSVSPELNGYSPQRSQAFYERAEAELAAIPGVSSVTAALVPLLSGSNWGTNVRVEGFEAGPDTDRNARYNEVGPGYFRTLGILVKAGREFTAADVRGAPKVALVNEAFAKKFGLGGDAVHKRIATGGEKELDTEIVGIAQNAKYSEVKQDAPPLFFRPYRQSERIGFLTFYVRTAIAPESLFSTIHTVMARLDPDLPIENLKTMPQQVRENVMIDRIISTLSAAFAMLATLLAAVGVYGVLTYTVAQRTREIGLRMALGADGPRVRGMVLWQVGKMTILGGSIGLAAAIALGTAARSLLFELKGHDPTVLAVSVALLALVALGSGLVPALKASRIDPMRALKYE